MNPHGGMLEFTKVHAICLHAFLPKPCNSQWETNHCIVSSFFLIFMIYFYSVWAGPNISTIMILMKLPDIDHWVFCRCYGLFFGCCLHIASFCLKFVLLTRNVSFFHWIFHGRGNQPWNLELLYFPLDQCPRVRHCHHKIQISSNKCIFNVIVWRLPSEFSRTFMTFICGIMLGHLKKLERVR